MNYCVYNRELDKFLYLVYLYDDLGGPWCAAEWDDEFVYALAEADSYKGYASEHVKTVWPMDRENERGICSVLIYRRIDEMNNSKNGMKDIRFVPVINGIPDFEGECAF